MFSLFQKKQITVEVASYEESRFVAGVQMVTEKKTYKSDVQKLQKRFYSLRDQAGGPLQPKRHHGDLP